MKKLTILFSRFISLLLNFNKTSVNFDLLEELKGRALEQDLKWIQAADDSAASKDWNNKVLDILEKIKKDKVKRFLSWKTIRDTMFIEYEKYISIEFEELKTHGYYKYLKESSFGKPTRYFLDPSTSANTIHHLYHIVQFEKETNIKLTDLDYILEFGGGYGNLAKLAHRLKFRGKYVIYDFPIFGIIQKFYLNHLDWEGERVTSNVDFYFANDF